MNKEEYNYAVQHLAELAAKTYIAGLCDNLEDFMGSIINEVLNDYLVKETVLKHSKNQNAHFVQGHGFEEDISDEEAASQVAFSALRQDVYAYLQKRYCLDRLHGMAADIALEEIEKS